MHANAQLLHKLFDSLNAREHAAMAEYYHNDATFEDIAFRLRGRQQIHTMWQMISETDLQATVEHVSADRDQGRVKLVELYTFRDTGRRIRNEIVGHFRFRDGLIIEHRDECDPLSWARQAFGGFKGELIGRVGLLRRVAARKKLHAFVADHPEYRAKP